MAKQDFYEILGISKSASQAEIKKGYRKMAIKYHPDKNPDDKTAEENFKKAAEAYEILSDENKKHVMINMVIRHLMDHKAAVVFGGGGMNMDDIFSQFGDIFGGAEAALVVLAVEVNVKPVLKEVIANSRKTYFRRNC